MGQLLFLQRSYSFMYVMNKNVSHNVCRDTSLCPDNARLLHNLMLFYITRFCWSNCKLLKNVMDLTLKNDTRNNTCKVFQDSSRHQGMITTWHVNYENTNQKIRSTDLKYKNDLKRTFLRIVFLSFHNVALYKWDFLIFQMQHFYIFNTVWVGF